MNRVTVNEKVHCLLQIPPSFYSSPCLSHRSIQTPQKQPSAYSIVYNSPQTTSLEKPEIQYGNKAYNSSTSSNKSDEDECEDHQHKENLHRKPSVGRDTIEIFQELLLRRIYIGYSVINVLIYADRQLPLLLNLAAEQKPISIAQPTELRQWLNEAM